MQNPANRTRHSRFAVWSGGVLVLTSALVLSQSASGQPSTLRLAPADGSSQIAPTSQGQSAPATTSPSPTGGRYGEAPPAARSDGATAGAAGAPPTSAQGARTPPASPATTQPAAAVPTSTIAFTLRGVPAGEMRQRLEKVLNRPLPARNDASGQWQTFAAQSGSGPAVMMAINIRSGEVRVSGPVQQVADWRAIVEAIDSPPAADGTVTQVVATSPAREPHVRRALGAIQLGAAAAQGTAALATMFFPQQPAGAAPGTVQPGAGGQPLPLPVGAGQQPGAAQAVEGVQTPGAPPALQQLSEAGLLGPVQITFIEGANIVLIRGLKDDVDRVVAIIRQIEAITKETTPDVQVYPLKYVNSVSMAALLTRVYDVNFAPRLGPLSVTALGKPNALLLVGPASNVQMAIERIVVKLDEPVAPTTMFEVFRLKHIQAANAKTILSEYLQQPPEGLNPDDVVDPEWPGLRPRAIVVVDTQTNSLVVSASQREIAEIAEILRRIDAPSGETTDIVRVFPLQYAVAADLATALQTAIEPADAGTPENRSQALELPGTQGGAPSIRSGVLTGIRVTADPGSNSLIVTATQDTMPLVEALISRLDVATPYKAAVKVFQLVNADATTIATTLQTLLPVPEAGVGALQEGLVPLVLTADPRSNTIIAAGSENVLATVHAILLTLDRGNYRQRTTRVYRLRYAFAQFVAQSLVGALSQEQQLLSTTPIGLYDLYDSAVIVVPEIVSNNLIISATDKYYDQIIKIIQDIDKRPPMVLVQVLIAEVRLTDTDEFGIELGIQDNILFDRAGGMIPSFNFLNPTLPLGNVVNEETLLSASSVAAQGLSHFGVGRVNSALGFGGFVFSANSDSVNFLLRALQEKRRLEILSRPQIQMLDAQQGTIFVGQTVSFVTGTTINLGIQTNNIQQVPVGLQLTVTPLIGLDGLVVMNVQVTKAEVGPEAEGTPVQITESGEVLRVPRIDQTQALTTVSAQSGQTIVLSGLLTTRKVDAHRRVPLVGDIPLIGDLFRYDAVNEEKRELLIVLTPQVVYTPEDGERLKRIESSRMSWILRDVVALHGEAGLRSRCDEWYEGEVDALYPGGMPTEGQILPMHEGEMLPGTPLLEQPGMQQPGIQPPRLQPTPPMGAPPGGAPPIPTPPIGGGASLNRQEASQNVATLRYDEPRPAAAKIQGTNIAPPLRLPSTD